MTKNKIIEIELGMLSLAAVCSIGFAVFIFTTDLNSLKIGLIGLIILIYYTLKHLSEHKRKELKKT